MELRTRTLHTDPKHGTEPTSTPHTTCQCRWQDRILSPHEAEAQFDLKGRISRLRHEINTREAFHPWPWPLGYSAAATSRFTVACWAMVDQPSDVRDVGHAHGPHAFPVVSHSGNATGWQLSMAADVAQFQVTLHRYPGKHHRECAAEYPTATGEVGLHSWASGPRLDFWSTLRHTEFSTNPETQ